MNPNRYFFRGLLLALIVLSTNAAHAASPSFPVYTSPSSGGTAPQNPTLRWNVCTDPDGDPVVYDVYLGSDVDPPLVASGLTTNSYASAILPHGAWYHWRIVARDPGGNSTSGIEWVFFAQYTNFPPAAASSPSPIDNATFQPASVLLSWQASDPNGDPLTYGLYLDDDNPPSFHGNLSTTSYLKTGLVQGTDYYWRVVTYDNHGGSTQGPVWKFRTNYRPVVALTSPTNGASNVPVGDGLSWQASDGDGDPLTYNVYFGASPTLNLIASNVTQNHIGLPMGTKTATAYSWRVDAMDNHGGVTTGPVWSFTTRANYVPEAAILEGPANGGSSSNPALLRWTGNDVDSPPQFLFYIVYLGTTNPPPVVATNISNTSYLASDLENSVQYFWRVETWDGFNSSLSEVWSFTPGEGPLTGAGDTPAVLTLRQNQPNPFNPQTTISYFVPDQGAPARVQLVVYDASGRLVRTLVDEKQAGGSRSVVWNGNDDRGGLVSSGVYFCVLQWGTERRTQKMVLLK